MVDDIPVTANRRVSGSEVNDHHMFTCPERPGFDKGEQRQSVYHHQYCPHNNSG